MLKIAVRQTARDPIERRCSSISSITCGRPKPLDGFGGDEDWGGDGCDQCPVGQAEWDGVEGVL